MAVERTPYRAITVVSLLVSAAITLLDFVSNEIKYSVVSSLNFGLLTFLAAEMIFSKSSIEGITEKFDGLFASLKRVDGSLHIKSSMFSKIFNSFEHDDDALSLPFVGAMRDAFEECGIFDHRVEVKGSSISEHIYKRFWDYIESEQERFGNITVYVSHSSSLDLFDKESVILQQQARFVHKGGRIFRILVRNDGAKYPSEQYDQVVVRMKKKGIHSYYLNNEGNDREIHDYLLVKLVSKWYVFEWIADWDKGSFNFGTIRESIIHSEPDKTDLFLNKWAHLVDVALAAASIDNRIELESFSINEI